MAAKKQRKKPAPPGPRKTTRAPTGDRLHGRPPRSLPHDTPVETPAVTIAPRALIEPPAPLPVHDVASVLASRPETIEAAYEAWDELRRRLTTLERAFREEADRLDQQAALLLGAVRAAAPQGGDAALARRTGLLALASDAEKSLEAARTQHHRRADEARTSLHAALAQVIATVRARVARQAELSPPLFELMVRVLPNDRRILHLRRPSPDGAVTMLFATSGRVPTRYGYLFDDATDDALLAPPSLYPDQGLTEVRAPPRALSALLAARPELWPVKGMVPMLLPMGFVRWLGRGPVLEAELADGDGFRNLLTTTEAEQLTGALLSLKLDGRVELELVRG